MFLTGFVVVSCSKNSINLKQESDLKYTKQLIALTNLFNTLKTEINQYYLITDNSLKTQLNNIDKKLKFLKDNQADQDYSLLLKTYQKINTSISWVRVQRELKAQQVLNSFQQLEIYFNTLQQQNTYDKFWLIKKYEQITNLYTKVTTFLTRLIQAYDIKAKTDDKYDALIEEINQLLALIKKEALANKVNN